MSNAACQVSKIIELLVMKSKILKAFTLYWHGGHLGHVTWPIYINFGSPLPKMLHIKFGFDLPSVLREEVV